MEEGGEKCGRALQIDGHRLEQRKQEARRPEAGTCPVQWRKGKEVHMPCSVSSQCESGEVNGGFLWGQLGCLQGSVYQVLAGPATSGLTPSFSMCAFRKLINLPGDCFSPHKVGLQPPPSYITFLGP